MSKFNRFLGNAGRALGATALCYSVASCSSETDTSHLEGKIVVYAGIALDGSPILMYALRTSDGREVELDFTEPPRLERGAQMAVDGTDVDGKFRVEKFDMVRGAENVAVAREALITHGPRDVAVIMVHWSQPGSFTPQEALNALSATSTSAGALISESSFGKVTINGNVFGWYQIQDPGSCDIGLIAERAQAAATAAGVNLGTYEHLGYVINPGTASCSFSGLGEVGTPASPARQTWYNFSSGTYLFAHELGHNLGFLHAHSYSCGTTIANRGACTFEEYGDPFDPMGVATSQFGAYHKAAQNWFEPCDVVTTPRSGVFNMAPSELSSTSIQLLRVPMSQALCPVDAAEPCYYYLESRRPLGAFDSVEPYSPSPMSNGLLVHANVGIDTSGNTFLTGPFLLDMTPGSTPPAGFFSTFWDASLGNGKAFGDPNGVRIRVLSQTSSNVKVAVKVPGGSGPISCLDGTQISSPASCGNGVKNTGESDVDCGGTICVPCDDGKTCVAAADCWSASCVSGTCAPSCSDGVKNGSETDSDCGGSCAADCLVGRSCSVNADCQSNRCSNGFCTSSQLLGTLNVHSNWQTGFCGTLTLQNTASTPTLTWSAQMNFEDSTFTSTSGAIFTPIGGGVTRLTPESWNSTIWPSSFETISFCATKTGPNYFPEFHYSNAQY